MLKDTLPEFHLQSWNFQTPTIVGPPHFNSAGFDANRFWVQVQ